jgi:hypothetical protein
MSISGGNATTFGSARGIALSLLAAVPLLTAAGDLDLINATLVDGTGAPPRTGVTVSVRNGKVAAISERAPAKSRDIRQIELGGRYLLPGLIDAHAHIESPAAALRALQSGVTTARVLGDTYRQAIGTRDLIRAGHVPGPELLVSPGHIRPNRAWRSSWSIRNWAMPSTANSAGLTGSAKPPKR